MIIEQIKLKNFRNYARAQVEPCPGITVLYGLNAQGKTNVLEAVYLCCTGRSHRTSRDRELISWGEDYGQVAIRAQRLDGSHEVEIHLSQLEKKQVLVGGSRVARSGELMGHVTGVLFSPEDLRMVKDGPAERRRFLDMELSQIQPSYYYQLQRYNRALNQRGALLRASAASDSLSVWDEQLALAGARIMESRRAFIARLDEAASAIHRGLSGNQERLLVAYQASVSSDESGDKLAERLLRALTGARETDLRRGITSVGPHRDDLSLRLNDIDVRAYGSQGQQRSCALSLKLSELRVMKEETGEYPILMLDDVMSELDPARRRQLLEQLSGVQTLITCTDIDDLAGAPVGKLYRVENGALQE